MEKGDAGSSRAGQEQLIEKMAFEQRLEGKGENHAGL